MKQLKDRLFKLVLFFLLAVTLGTNIYLFQEVQVLKANGNNNNNGLSNSETMKVNYEISDDITDLVESVEDKVVGILNYVNGRANGSGSGAIYKVEGNTVYIITNNHVISGASSIEVVFTNGERVMGELIGGDSYTDLAVVRVEVDFEVEAFDIGNSDLLKTGQTVIAIGSPLGLDLQGSVTKGIISGTNRTISVDTNGDGIEDVDMGVIQTDAAINPGNSGGPLINMAGELIGINSVKISGSSVEGIGFAIPVNDIVPIVDELETTGKVTRPVLGITGLSVSEATYYQRRNFGIDNDVKSGLLIASILDGGAAKESGLQAGDVIMEFGGEEIADFKSFISILYEKKPGDEIVIKYLRNNQINETTVILK